jgi:hypothetical protein
VDELDAFLGPGPGRAYLYGFFNEGTREVGSSMLVTSAPGRRGGLRVQERATVAGLTLPPGSEAMVEYELRVADGSLWKALPDGDVVVLRSPLRVGTRWTAPAVSYTPEGGWSRSDVGYHIAMIEELTLFDEPRLTVRVLGRGRLPSGEVTVTEQHAAGIGLVLRRTHLWAGGVDTGASEMVLEQIRTF